MSFHEIEAQFSTNRLGGEPVPPDLRLLLKHRDELRERTGIIVDWSAIWAPWLDTSYLTPADFAKPDIRANVRAMTEVCRLAAFVAADEDGNYFGYWRGAAQLPINQALPLWLDNEGQFDLCGTSNIAGALLAYSCSGWFDECHQWFQELGITSLPSNQYDLGDPDIHPTPHEVHDELFHKYLAEESGQA